MVNQKQVKIEEWIDRCINGSGGLLAMEKYEWGIRLGSDEIVAASWIIRCLANPNCEGSEEVLQAIIDRRKEVAQSKGKYIGDGKTVGDGKTYLTSAIAQKVAESIGNTNISLGSMDIPISIEPSERVKKSYGTFNGHNKWDLAVNWFQMSNDNFHKMYGFNFVPKGRLFDEAKNYLSKK